MARIVKNVILTDLHNHLGVIENYLKGEHNHETDKIQEAEDTELFNETVRLKDIVYALINE